MPTTLISVLAADNSLTCASCLIGRCSGGIRRNCSNDMQDTEAPVSYNQVPSILLALTFIKGLFCRLRLPITSIAIVGTFLFFLERFSTVIVSTKIESPERRSLLGAVPSFRENPAFHCRLLAIRSNPVVVVVAGPMGCHWTCPPGSPRPPGPSRCRASKVCLVRPLPALRRGSGSCKLFADVLASYSSGRCCNCCCLCRCFLASVRGLCRVLLVLECPGLGLLGRRGRCLPACV